MKVLSRRWVRGFGAEFPWQAVIAGLIPLGLAACAQKLVSQGGADSGSGGGGSITGERLDGAAAAGGGSGADTGTPRDLRAETASVLSDGAQGAPLDAAPTDAGGDGAGPCGALLCEDFEKGSVDKTFWKTEVSGKINTVTVQGDVVAHGKWAMKAHAEGGNGHAFMYTQKVPLELRSHHFGRAYLQQTQGPVTGHPLFIFASNSPVSAPYGDKLLEIGVSGDGSQWSVLAFLDRGPGRGGKFGALGKWVCVEWEFTDLPATSISLWADGQFQTKLSNIGSRIIGGFGTIGFGHRSANAAGGNPINIYIDDYAIDSNRIGCIE